MDKNKVLTNAFTWLFIGLLVSFGISFITSLNESIFYQVYGWFGGYGYLIYAVAELIIAFILSLRIHKLKPLTAKVLYLAYAALTGLSLSGLFLVYTSSSLTFVFLAAALVFGIFAIIGKTTKVDLSKWSIYVFIALIAIIVFELLNVFLFNNSLNLVLSIVGILIFCFYIAYDIQNALDQSYLANSENKGIFCAFQLYLDFINVFIDLLRLFGKTRD